MSDENLRQTLLRQRETLTKLIREIDAALADAGDTRPAMQQPLVTPPVHDDLYDEVERDSRSRLLMMVIAGILALGLIAGVIWWASKDRGPEVVTDTATTTSPSPPAPLPVERGEGGAERSEAPGEGSTLRVTPAATDYGTIAKGTRATRQFEVANESDQPMSVSVARSTCRCLYYEYAPVIPPKAKETITVTIDGAKAAAGPLQETVRVTAKSDPAVFASFDVTATIR